MGGLGTPYQGEPTAILLPFSGDTVVLTPGVGAKLRIYWVGMSTSQDNTGETIVTIKIGSKVKYIWAMGNPGAFSHRDLLVGDKGESLVVNLSQAQPVLFNYTYEEVY